MMDEKGGHQYRRGGRVLGGGAGAGAGRRPGRGPGWTAPPPPAGWKRAFRVELYIIVLIGPTRARSSDLCRGRGHRLRRGCFWSSARAKRAPKQTGRGAGG